MLICINLYIEYSFHTILGTRFLFGEPNFSRSRLTKEEPFLTISSQ